MGEKSVLKFKARRRVAIRTAVGVISAGLVFGAIPLLGSASADTTTVSYDCTASVGGGTEQSPTLNATLTGTAVTGTGIQKIALTWVHAQGTPQLTAPVEITTSDRIIYEGVLVMTGTAQTATVTATVTAPAVAVTSGSAMPLATIMATASPTATGIFTVKTNNFTLRIGPATGQPTHVYTCVIDTTATAAAATVTVTSASASTTPTPTPTPTPTASTPRPTRTVTATVTADDGSQVTNTPGGGVATGGGGELGPDARVLIMTGTALILAAIFGGLVLRSRRGAVRD
ncbi:hypothetical protein [Acrocarpospora catenulata]|uniref:hypothetical protein n=1 Tax=Acrocarpospora catenulata TaxID=2836182 RepID=UPI001BDA4426|nr:hypothetical protein [Acrocarpospora catenulata]